MKINKKIDISRVDVWAMIKHYTYRSQNAVIKKRRYFYNEYLLTQEMKWDNTVLKEFTWDPTESTATKPLTMTVNTKGYNLLYTHDGNKNISDVAFFASGNGIGAHYEYSPFGATVVSTSNSRITDVNIRAENPFRFSSEYHDDELGLIYYNYRHYNTLDGRWLSRDPIEEKGGWNLYGFTRNNSINKWDILGKFIVISGDPFIPIVVSGYLGKINTRISQLINEVLEEIKLIESINIPEKCKHLKDELLQDLKKFLDVFNALKNKLDSTARPLIIIPFPYLGDANAMWFPLGGIVDTIILPYSWGLADESERLSALLHELMHTVGVKDDESSYNDYTNSAHTFNLLMIQNFKSIPQYLNKKNCIKRAGGIR